MSPFTQRKFLSFPLEQQHKKCAELLRVLYSGKGELATYNTLQEWMEAPSLTTSTPEAISNRYHHHLQKAGQQLKEHNLLPTIRRQDAPTAARAPGGATIYLDNIRSAHNVGSILRTTEAFAIGKVHFSTATPYIDNPQVQKTSMETHAWVPCAQCSDLNTLPRPLIALETSPEATPIDQFLFPKTFTLALGNEEYGCSEATLRTADHLIEIPMAGRKNSLNVANAYAIVAAEIYRQQEKMREQ